MTQRLSVRIHRATHWEMYGHFVQFSPLTHGDTHYLQTAHVPLLNPSCSPQTFLMKMSELFLPATLSFKRTFTGNEDLWSGSCRSNTHQQQLSHLKGSVYSECVCVCARMEAGPEPTLQKVRQLDKARGRLDAWCRRKAPAINGESSERNFNRNVRKLRQTTVLFCGL